MPRYEILAATSEHLEGIAALAAFLDTVNLPNDPREIQGILARSEGSFRGDIADPKRREYVFVLRDADTGRIVGTSMVFGQLGHKDAPYIYFDVSTEEKYSPSFDRHFAHRVLTIGYSFDGPTEIGGLVVHPDLRRSPARLGRLISYVRFLWIAMRRAEFREEVLAELLPPLEPDGTSRLWEAVGRHFTGITYQEADKLSKRNKEFIRSLFPNGDIYASLLPREAQDVIGKVGPQTRGVEKLLQRIGFRYAHRVDPFDGGPHFLARTDEISLVQKSLRGRVVVGEVESRADVLVAVEHAAAPWFHAVPAPVERIDAATVRLAPAAAAALRIEPGASVWVLPLHA